MSSNRKLCLLLRSPLHLQIFNWDATLLDAIGRCFSLLLHATTKAAVDPITEVHLHLIANCGSLAIN